MLTANTRDLRALEHAGELEAGELAALVGVEDLGSTVFGQRLVQRFDAEPGIRGVRQLLDEGDMAGAGMWHRILNIDENSCHASMNRRQYRPTVLGGHL